MRRPLVAGNWKMNGSCASIDVLLEALIGLAPSVTGPELLVLPPYPYFQKVREKLAPTSIALGAQNVSEHDDGAFTGEISAEMLKDCGCHYVLVGHSERRTLFGESSETVAKKFWKAISAGLKPILCVGETLAQRESGKTSEIVQEQLAAVLKLKDNLATLSNAVIAYEPVWAIGTGLTATPEEAQTVHALIRQTLANHDPALAKGMRIMYGGSVKPENAASLLAMKDIDGALIGGASLNATQFIEIAKSCNN
jgi:triosephosphate isomerase